MTDDAAGRTRRRFLGEAGAGLAVGLGTAGCLGDGFDPLGDDDGILLRARSANGTETDTRCRLSSAFVAAHPALESVLTRAGDDSDDEWARTRLSVETGESLGDALDDHCDGETRGVYEYDGEWYFVSLQYEDPKDHDHHAGAGHDAETTAE